MSEAKHGIEYNISDIIKRRIDSFELDIDIKNNENGIGRIIEINDGIYTIYGLLDAVVGNIVEIIDDGNLYCMSICEVVEVNKSNNTCNIKGTISVDKFKPKIGSLCILMDYPPDLRVGYVQVTSYSCRDLEENKKAMDSLKNFKDLWDSKKATKKHWMDLNKQHSKKHR